MFVVHCGRTVQASKFMVDFSDFNRLTQCKAFQPFAKQQRNTFIVVVLIHAVFFVVGLVLVLPVVGAALFIVVVDINSVVAVVSSFCYVKSTRVGYMIILSFAYFGTNARKIMTTNC